MKSISPNQATHATMIAANRVVHVITYLMITP
jgi:hypothetical protein